MEKRRETYYRILFLCGAIYDIVLGIIFTLFYKQVFKMLKVDPPSGPYVMLIGAFLIVIGIAYLLVYLSNLKKNQDLIAVGTLYKLAYMTIAIVALASGTIPHILFALVFGVADAVFFVLMGECWLYIRKLEEA
ncbi:MAG: hypothetical protein HQ557_11145 [Bacteroidetes bacterium]|nr:hypothetical protein [Bacteroidota bacterium]